MLSAYPAKCIGSACVRRRGKAKAAGIITSICLACSKVMDVYEKNITSGLPIIGDMSGHAGMKSYLNEGCEVISI